MDHGTRAPIAKGGAWRRVIFSLILGVPGSLLACASKKGLTIDLMPAPDVYSDGVVDPFRHFDETMDSLPFGIFYATDRRPSEKGPPFYLNERGFNLRLGLAQIELGRGEYTWEEARRISLLKNRPGKYPLSVKGIEEIGILDTTLTMFTSPESTPHDPKAASNNLAELINAKLAGSHKKDVYIYVHGYKVAFVNPILVTAELWHFLGYDGVFIAFAWPSTPETLAYASDLETAGLSSFNLRHLIEFVARETDAEQIHIIGYSAGTRLVINALMQLAFIHRGKEKTAIQKQEHIGRIVLTGSDFDGGLFGAYLVEGLMKVPKTMSVYVSNKDKALGISKRIFRRARLGQMRSELISPIVVEYLNTTPEMQIISVAEAEGADEGNGHAYFRNSPWVSSDILMTLMHDLEPAARGLIRLSDSPIWRFPNDYIKQQIDILVEKNYQNN